MRAYAALSPTDGIPLPPDSVQTLLLAAATAQAFDWPTATGGAAANAAIAGAQLVRFSAVTTGMSAMGCVVNLVSTHAVGPSSGSSVTTGTTAGSTGNSVPIVGQGTFQIPTWSTGWSAVGPVAGYVIAEIWRK